jgi:SAM-dependent methyltransferase
MTRDVYYTDPVVAQAYDRVVESTNDLPFYIDLARAASERGEGVLELACGTGRVTIPVAQAGALTTGLDNSVAMLQIAERKAEAAGVDVTWVQGDMASFRLEQRFGLVTIPASSFLLLTTTAAQKACLGSVSNHLSDHGLLALHIFNPSLPLMAARLGDGSEGWEYAADGSRVRREYHTGQQLLVETRQDSFDSAAEPAYRTLRARWVYRYEMQHLLELCGFKVEALHGGFEGQPFGDSSTEMVWIARKA